MKKDLDPTKAHTFNFRLPGRYDEIITDLAKRRNANRSDVIRTALNSLVEDNLLRDQGHQIRAVMLNKEGDVDENVTPIVIVDLGHPTNPDGRRGQASRRRRST